MGQGRRGLALVAVLLCALTAAAGELPDAPSSSLPPAVPAIAPHDLSGLPSYDLSEWMAAPVLVESPKPRRVFDKKFGLLAGLAAGLTLVDYELTQRCMARNVCAEADPLLPHSRAGMYATNIPLNAAVFWWSYRRKAAGKRLWWLPPLVVIASHAVGVGTNIRFVGK